MSANMRIRDSKSFLFQYKREQIYWPGLLENTCSLGKYSAGFYLPLFVENKRRFRSLFPRLPSQASLASPAEHLGKMKWVAEVHDNENRKTGGRATRTTFYFSSLAPIMFQHFQRSPWFYTHYWFMLQPADLKQNSIWWFNILCEMLHKHFKWLLRNGLL